MSESLRPTSEAIADIPPTEKSLEQDVVIPKFSCPHYKRKCDFYTPCCQKSYKCRFCHDTHEKTSHVLKRDAVTEIVCSVCQTKQPVQKMCQNCHILFAKYYCFMCKLYDDDEKGQYHCSGCGICRLGGRDNYFHCSGCNMCLPVSLRGKHKCIENLSRANCPVCLEDIHTSREACQIPPCHHLIHKTCYSNLQKAGHYFCPVCSKSLVDLGPMWVAMDGQIAANPMHGYYKDMYVSILCRDCNQSCVAMYHVLGMRCIHCGGYNTIRDEGPFLRKEDNQYKEASPPPL